MAMGISIHIGLNRIDTDVYGAGNDLSGCINDARDMQSLAVAQGFQTQLMTDEGATAATVISAISGAAQSLRSGDILFLTYSGHGSNVTDTSGDETDGLDETWCLYDRMLIDDELYQLWGQFQAGVRIIMLSDSCHSGTVARMIRARQLTQELAKSPVDTSMRSLKRLEAKKRVISMTKKRALAYDTKGPPPTSSTGTAVTIVNTNLPSVSRDPKFRFLNPSASDKAYGRSKELYDTLQRLIGRKVRDTVDCSVILISGCQDNQLSADGDNNGRFTEALLNVWNNGSFTGDYRALHQAIVDLMPMEQTPNFFCVGAQNLIFERQKPFTITTNASNEPVTSALWVTGPATMSRQDGPPSFEVNPGPNSYYIFEITTDASLFDTGNASDRRNDDNFYGSWSDTAHHTERTYTLPQYAWDRLKGAARLYYRIGSTAASDGWLDYMVSTPDQQYDNAPSIALEGAGANDNSGDNDQPTSPTSSGPSIYGPDDIAASDAAPSFDIDTAGAPYFIVEVATDASLFSAGDGPEDQFYATWQDQPLLTGSSYTLCDEAWQRLNQAENLYYRVGTTTSETGWENYMVSTDGPDWQNAPSIRIEVGRSLARRDSGSKRAVAY